MVGLKTFWILSISLFLFAACLPQTKQTECGDKEAFNATLRTCVPVTGKPETYLNIGTYEPQFALTRYKDDPTILTFKITVSNPYALPFTVAWERIYNAAPPISICSNAQTCSFPAALLSADIGTHIIKAKILDSKGEVADSHSFELKINNQPKPIIETLSYIPEGYSVEKIPTDPIVPFSFLIKNNNAAITADNKYRTTWTILRNGVVVGTPRQVYFSDLTPTGTNLTTFNDFDPAVLGVGSYIVRAIVNNEVPGEIVDQHQWNVIVKDPELGKITDITLPAPGVTITAHHNVAYNDFPTDSWVAGATKPNFCIEVDDRDGTYEGDSKSLEIKFYLDGIGGDICTKRTLDTPGTQVVCLVDTVLPCAGGAFFDPSVLKFSNPSPEVSLLHKVTARVYDEATGQEYKRSNITEENGSYPIELHVMVNPINTPPKMAFGPAASNPLGCITSGPFSKSGCLVRQNEPFRISFSVTDDFYSPISRSGEFLWDVKLKYNNADVITPPFVTSCTKALGVVSPADASNVWTCDLRVPHYIASGALHPNGPFQVVASIADSGSPIGGLPLPGQSLTWTLNVTETNGAVSDPNITLRAQSFSPTTSHIKRIDPVPATVMDPSGTNYVTELQKVEFHIAVTDPELDDFTYSVYKCGPGSTSTDCKTPTLISSPAMSYLRSLFPPVVLPFTDVINTDPVLVNAFTYTLPETLLLDAGHDVGTTAPAGVRPVYFQVEVIDKPSTLPMAQYELDSKIYTLHVLNHNPAPKIGTTGVSPAPNSAATSYPVIAGFPFTIYPGDVTDDSVAAAESTISYQWYARSSSATPWYAISGATSKELYWTPSRNSPANIEFKLCVGDRPFANPIAPPAPTGTGNCSTSSWHVSPKTYLASPASSADVTSEVAVWHDTNDGDPAVEVIYTAFVAADAPKTINVNKITRNATGDFNLIDTATVQFTPLSSGSVPTQIVGLSLTGTADSLYISYAASTNLTDLRPQIRRIDKSFGLTVGEKSGFIHKGKFGFSYNAIPTRVCASASACTITAEADSVGMDVSPASIAFDNTIAALDTVSINGVIFTASATPTGPLEFCTIGPSTGCSSPADVARSLATKINASREPNLQGLTAVDAGTNTVTFYGLSTFDHLDVPRLIGNGQIGKIFIVGGRWYLPIVNASEVLGRHNNITVISGAVDKKVGDNEPSYTDYTDTLTSLGAVQKFDAKVNQNDELIIASIDANDLIVKLSRFTLTGTGYEPLPAPAVASVEPFSTKRFASVELSANTTGNNSIYLMGKEVTVDGGSYHMSRYTSDLTSGDEYELENQLTSTDATSTLISDALLSTPTLLAVPNSMDARLFFKSANNIYVARWRSDNTLSCGACVAIGNVNSTSRIALSKVAINTTLGTSGYIANENQKDVTYLFSNFFSGVSYNWQVGIINLEPELINSTSPDTTNNLWGVPFSK